MSFWPFGHSLNNSNVNRILDDYFNVLHALEKSNPAVAESVQQNFSGSGNGESGGHSPDEISSVDLNERQTSGFRPSNGSSSSSSSLSSKTDLDEDDIASATKPMVITLQSLNSSFIDKILDESELLNELTRQNSNLLDFICFGFFYEPKTHAKIQHMDYLIDQMLECIDSFSEDTINPSRDSPMASVQEKDQDLNDNDNEELDENAVSCASENKEQKLLNKANIISEILSLDIWLITESLMKKDTHLSRIWSMLKHPNMKSEKSPLVSMFLKINQNLLVARKDQYLNFIRSLDHFVDDLLAHVDVSMLMDFLLKCIATDKVEVPTGVIEHVDEQRLVRKCLEFLNNEKYDPDIQACAGDFLKALIAISANAPLDDMSIGPNSLTRQLASLECIENLVDIIIKRGGSALNITVSIVIELIRKNNSDYDQVNLLTTNLQSNPPSNRDPIYLGYMLRHFAQKLPELFDIILDADNDPSIPMLKNQLNEHFKPLGFERFKIVELIAELLHCSNMGLMNSKRAERIAAQRDKARTQLAVQLQDALEDLSIEDKKDIDDKQESKNDKSIDEGHNYDHDDNKERDKDDYDNDNNENASVSGSGETKNQNPSRAVSDISLSNDVDLSDEEVDESFEIPYVNENQNAKLRKNPTIGDLFKIMFYDTQILPKIIQLFLSHPWNNFWHNVIFDIIQQIFNGRMDFSYNSFLVYSLFNLNGSKKFMPEAIAAASIFDNFKLTKDFILQGYQNSYAFYEKKRTNLGYMGHLVLIAEEVVKFSKLYKVELISPDIHDTLQDEGWRFYAEDVLNDTRIMYSKILGGGNYVDDGNGNIVPQLPEQLPSSNDDASEEEDKVKGGGLINVESLEEQLGLSTESDLHEKLKEILIANSQQEVEKKNKENGVIILGPPPE